VTYCAYCHQDEEKVAHAKDEEFVSKLNPITEKLYELNAKISLGFIGLQETPRPRDMEQINQLIGNVVQELRFLEKELSARRKE